MRQFVRRCEDFVIPGYEPWLSRLLNARGINNAEDAEAFLSPSLDALHDPLLLFGMREAVALIKELGARGARAVVYGDYDVDGICSSVIAREALQAAGLKTVVYIPDRHTEGYGINEEAVRRLAGEAELLLTVDCGVTAVSEAALAKELGLRLIITDHHTPPDTLPVADALINPMLGGYPFPALCGAGVAWKLSWALHG
ncbi:MAG: single-stranded-DNA-specific exonuclease RecJ, partial [Clostridiales bacterium]|nr:single-stranded-DNA-specific exonuclease RecJ [Clostridiales bacterium]